MFQFGFYSCRNKNRDGNLGNLISKIILITAINKTIQNSLKTPYLIMPVMSVMPLPQQETEITFAEHEHI